MSISIPAQVQSRIEQFRTGGSLGPGADRQALTPFDAEAMVTHVSLESVVIASADGQQGVDEDAAAGRVRFSQAQLQAMVAENQTMKGLTAYTATYEGARENPTAIAQDLQVGPFRCLRISEGDPASGAVRRFEVTLADDGYQLFAAHLKVGGESYGEVVKEAWKKP